MKNFLGLLIALIPLLVIPLASEQNPAPATVLPVGSAMVNEVKGTVSIRSPQGDALVPQRGLVLATASTIETAKGSVLLDLQDGSQVLVKADSRVVLRAPNEEKGYYLELLIGKIIAKVQKRLGNAPSFKMGTPTAVITVRGTRFLVDVNRKQRTKVDVYEGLVEVNGMGGGFGAPVMIRPGFGTDIELNRPPENPREFGSPSGALMERGNERLGDLLNAGGFDDFPNTGSGEGTGAGTEIPSAEPNDNTVPVPSEQGDRPTKKPGQSDPGSGR